MMPPMSAAPGSIAGGYAPAPMGGGYPPESPADDYPAMRPGQSQRDYDKAVKRWQVCLPNSLRCLNNNPLYTGRRTVALLRNVPARKRRNVRRAVASQVVTSQAATNGSAILKIRMTLPDAKKLGALVA